MFPLHLKDDGFQEPAEPIYYLLARNGLFAVKETAFFRSVTRVEGLSWLEEQEEGVQLKLPARIPLLLIRQVVAFFQEIYRRHQAEAVVLLYYNGEARRYELVVPEQEASPLRCWYEIGPTPPGWQRVGTIHSHGKLPAFHSGADVEDEAHDDGIHITVGNLDFVPSLSCDVVVDGRRFDIAPMDLVDGAETVEWPQQWLERVSATGYPAGGTQ